MKVSLAATSISLLAAAGQAQEIISVGGPLSPNVPVLMTGKASASLIPFNLDFTKIPDYKNFDVALKYSTSIWQSVVSLYDGPSGFASFLSLLWPSGQGPGAPPVNSDKEWNACVVAIPDLFDRLQVKARTNGSCFDVVNQACLYNLIRDAATIWKSSLIGETTLSKDAYTRACKSVDKLLLIPNCFNSTQEFDYIKAYSTLNPRNGQPFLLGLDKYTTDNKADVQAKASSKTWPLLTLEAAGKEVVNGAFMCPSASIEYFSDTFDRGNLDGWTVYGKDFDASSKALVGKAGSSDKAVINGLVGSDFVFEADITPTSKGPSRSMSAGSGLFFRASSFTDKGMKSDGYKGFYVKLAPYSNKVLWGHAGGNNVIIPIPANIVVGQVSHVKILAQGDYIALYVGDMKEPIYWSRDPLYSSGQFGVVVDDVDASFDNIAIKPLPPKELVPTTDGTCGGLSGFKCISNSTDSGIFYGKCCGADGFCGYSADTCRNGCQPQFGTCDTVVTVTAPPKSTTTTASSTSTAPAQPTSTDGWKILGCYKDLYPSSDRTLKDYQYINDPLSISVCRAKCLAQQYKYSGVENGNECWCGNTIQSSATNTLTSLSDCSYSCPGEASESCGAGARILLSEYSAPLKSTWTTLGCYKDVFPSKDRTLREPQVVFGQLTVDSCRATCAAKQYKYSGVENGGECWCGDSIQSPSDNVPVAMTDCSYNCPGNSSQKCGAGARIVISQRSKGITAGWEDMGCYQDTFATHARTLKTLLGEDGSLTIDSCRNICRVSGYQLSGMENGRECWCGNSIQDPSYNIPAPLSDCSKTCPGDPKQFCGGGGRISLSRYVDPSKPAWVAMGCYKDRYPATSHALQVKIDVDGATTIEKCQDRCYNSGYSYSGVEDGSDCWCGNDGVQAPSDNVPTDEANCNKPCSGDANVSCGASGYISLSRRVG